MTFDIFILLAVLGLVFCLLLVLWTKRRLSVPKGARCLLVVAHPDDECMFFGPTILQLRASGCSVSVLCASVGGADGLGDIREKEMFRACETLGLRRCDVTIMDISDMRDGNVKWETEKLARIVLQYIEKLEAHYVITFDEKGVSGHPNHISCFKALQFLYTNGHIPTDTQVFVLDSVSLLRKYSGILDLVASQFAGTFLCTASPRLVYRAMSEHRSQLVWFRFLYMAFSRYVIINTLRRIPLHRLMSKKRA